MQGQGENHEKETDLLSNMKGKQESEADIVQANVVIGWLEPYLGKSAIVGRGYMLFSSLIFSLGYFFIRFIPDGAMELGYTRATLSVILGVVMSKLSQDSLFGTWESYIMACKRGTMGGLASVAINISLKCISLSLFTVFGRMKSLLAIYMGMLFLRNPFRWETVALGVIGIFGVTLVIVPGIYGLDDGSGQSLQISWSVIEIIGLISTMAFMFLDVSTSILLIKMADKVRFHEGFTNLQGIMALIHAGILTFQGKSLSLNLSTIWYYIPCTLCFYVGHIFYNEGARLEKNAGLLAVLQTSIAAFSVMFDLIFLGVHISGVNYVGGFIVIGTSLIAILFK